MSPVFAICTSLRKKLWETDSGTIPLCQGLLSLTQAQHDRLKYNCSLYVCDNIPCSWSGQRGWKYLWHLFCFCLFQSSKYIYPSNHSIFHSFTLSPCTFWGLSIWMWGIDLTFEKIHRWMFYVSGEIYRNVGVTYLIQNSIHMRECVCVCLYISNAY